MQVVVFASVLFTTAYAPEFLLADWLETIADLNPTRYILDGVRRGSSSASTGPRRGTRCSRSASLLLVLGGFALRRMNRLGR